MTPLPVKKKSDPFAKIAVLQTNKTGKYGWKVPHFWRYGCMGTSNNSNWRASESF